MSMALFNIDETTTKIQIHLDGKLISSEPSSSLKDNGVQHGDLLYVTPKNSAGTSSNGNGLNFSNLLGGGATTTNNASSSSGGGRGGLDFSTLLSSSSTPSSSQNNKRNGGAVNVIEWPGMTLDDSMQRNKNPDAFVRVLFKYENIMKELNYHSPVLAGKLKACNGNVVCC